MTRTTESVIGAVSYADVFDFPLYEREVRLWSRYSIHSVPRIRGIERRNGYVVIQGRSHLIGKRLERARVAREKWQRARRLVQLFRIIPTVTLIGVTGGMAMDNVEPHDDIDLFFITRRGTLWITRMIATILSDRYHIRRKPEDTIVSDKVCLNMFMSEDTLGLPSSERDLFSAHEVLQMVPMWERDNAYRKFLRANAWVKGYLPNAWKHKNHARPDQRSEAGELRIEKVKKSGLFSFIIHASSFMIQLLEPLAKMFQLWYMGRRRTNEVIRNGQIRFHPKDARVWVRKKLDSRLRYWDIPLDNIFYHR